MAYLQVELDAKKLMGKAARAAGVSPGDVCWALMELWEYVYSAKRDVVGEMVLDGCLGANAKLREALVAFGFLESVDRGFRVRGATRYLGFSQAQAERGKARAKSAKRDARGRLVAVQPDIQPAGVHGVDNDTAHQTQSSRNPAGHQPESSRPPAADQPHQTPNTKHQEEAVVPAAPGGELELVPPKATKQRTPSKQERLSSMLAARRLAHLGDGAAPDLYPAARVNRMFLPLVEQGLPDDAWLATFDLFLEADRPAGLDPPFPLWAFATDWPQFLSKATRGQHAV